MAETPLHEGTETASDRYSTIETWPVFEIVEAQMEGQLGAVACLRSQTSTIAQAAEAAAGRLKGTRGRLVFCGAGTSGRIAVQDGVELGPTYSWPDERMLFLMAGGARALAGSVEDAEDQVEQAIIDLEQGGVSAHDVVISVAASGSTPFTLAVQKAARDKGALTIAIANNPDRPLLQEAEYAILADTGPELVAGSTRMKAGTAQKVVLNMLTTTIMMRLGRVYRGRMVDMRISNKKLRRRSVEMVAELAGIDEAAAQAALTAAKGHIKLAVLMGMTGLDAGDAQARLDAGDGDLHQVLKANP